MFLNLRKKISILLVFAFLLSFFPTKINVTPNPIAPYPLNYMLEFVGDFIERRTQSLIAPIVVVEKNNEFVPFSEQSVVVQEARAVFTDEERIATDISGLREALSQFSMGRGIYSL